MKRYEATSRGWVRVPQIAMGAIVVTLSIHGLAFSGVTFLATLSLLVVILFVVGIETIISGVFTPILDKSKWSSVGLGILALVSSFIVIAFLTANYTFLLEIVAIGLLFDGMARVVQGIGAKSSHNASRIFSSLSGVIAIALSIATLLSPFFGVVFGGVLLSLALLIIGIQIIAAGIIGIRQF
ncbi:hypothetical protein BH18THE2_BH18THE2_10180 [soil metagenome]